MADNPQSPSFTVLDLLKGPRDTYTNPAELGIKDLHTNSREMKAASVAISSLNDDSADVKEVIQQNRDTVGDLSFTYAQLSKGKIENSLNSLLESAIQTTNPEAIGSVKAAQEVVPSQIVQDAMSGDPWKESKAEMYGYFNENFPIQKFTEDFKNDLAARHHVNKILADAADKSSEWTATDLLGLMFVPDMRLDLGRLSSRLELGNAIRAAADPVGWLKSINYSLDKLEPEVKARSVQIIADELEDIESNPLKRQEILEAMLKFSPEENHFVWESAPALGVIAGPSTNIVLNKLGKMVGLNKAEKIMKEFPGRVVAAAKKNNAIKMAARAGNHKAAAKAADAAVRDHAVAKSFGIDEVEAAAAGDPMAHELSDILRGAPTEQAAEISKNWRAMDQVLKDSEELTTEIAPFSRAEKTKALEDRLARDASLPDYSRIKWQDTDDGARATFFKKDPETGEESEILTRNYEFTIDDITGTFVTKEVSPQGAALGKFFASPNFTLGQDREFLVNAGARFLSRSAKIEKAFADSFKLAVKDIKDPEKVAWFLRRGDLDERVFDYDTAVNQGIGGMRLSPDDYKVYAGVRKLYDQLWSAENKRLIQEKKFLGEKSIDIDGEIHYARPYDTVRSGLAAARLKGYNQAIIRRTDGKTEVGPIPAVDDLNELYDEGYRMVVASSGRDTFRTGINDSVGVAIVPRNKISDIEGQVLNRRVGYVNRIPKDLNYFVKRADKARVEGVDTLVGQSTLRAFRTREEAEAWMSSHLETLRAQGKAARPEDWSVSFDGEQSFLKGAEGIQTISGGLYRGSRKSEPLRVGAAGDLPEYEDALESAQRYVSHVAFRSNIARYRLGLHQKWLNSARDWAEAPENMGFEDALDWVAKNTALNSAVKEKLLKSAEQIKHMTRIPTRSEAEWEGWVRSFGEKLEGTGLKNLAPYIYRMKHNDLQGKIRATNFHLMLGLYMPAQIFVQASAATIAWSIYPKAATRALRYLFNGARADMMEGSQKKAFIEGLKDPEFKELMTAWNKTGGAETVLNFNADYSSLLKGMPVGPGAAKKLYAGSKEILRTGTVYSYGIGDLVARRTAFFTAYLHNKPLKNTMTDDEYINYVFGKADQLTLSMSSANKANFQKGWWSIPGQFKQVLTKFAEATLGQTGKGSAFTGPERLKLFLGQAALFGAAGVPFLDFAIQAGAPAGTLEKLEPEDKTLLRRGVVGWLINEQFEIDALFTGRMALGKGLEDELIKIGTEEQNLMRALAGPFWTTQDRVLTAMGSLLTLGNIATWGDEVEEGELIRASELFLSDLAAVPSTGKYAQEGMELYKTYVLGNSTIFRKSNGDLLFVGDKPNLQTVVSRFLGFGSQQKADLYEVLRDGKRSNQQWRVAKDQFKRFCAKSLNVDTPDELRSGYNLCMSMIVKSFDGQDRINMMNEIRRDLTNPKSPIDRAIREQIKHLTSEIRGSALQWNPTISKYLKEERNEDGQ